LLHSQRLPLVLDLDLTLIHAMFKKDLDRAEQGELSKKHISTVTGMEQPRAPSEDEWKGHSGHSGPATNMANAIRAGRDPDAGMEEAGLASRHAGEDALTRQHNQRLEVRKLRAGNLQHQFNTFYQETRNKPMGPPKRVRMWNSTSVFITRCTVLGAEPNQLYPFVCAMRPGFSEFIEELSSMYELFIYTNGMRPYAEQVIRCTPLCNIQKANIRCREKMNDDVKKNSALLVKYARGLVVIVDDCEGNPVAERVWPKDAHHVHVVKPYDCLEASQSDSTELDNTRRILGQVHSKFYKMMDDMQAQFKRKDWLDIALVNGHPIPRIPDLMRECAAYAYRDHRRH